MCKPELTDLCTRWPLRAAACLAIVALGGPSCFGQVGGLGSASVVRPRATASYYAFPYFSVFGPPAVNLGFPQPLGHQIISYGRYGYVYRPVTDLGAFVDRAQAAMLGADYQRVLIELEPVLAEAPGDGQAWMIQAQALFALANYGKAAEALHIALRLLPREQWGAPVTRQLDYFRSPAEYEARLQALEKHVAAHPNEGAGHFLLGYHYGFQGRTPEAERELRAALKLMTGDDTLADALLEPVDPPAAPSPIKPRPALQRDKLPPPRASGPRDF